MSQQGPWCPSDQGPSGSGGREVHSPGPRHLGEVSQIDTKSIELSPFHPQGVRRAFLGANEGGDQRPDFREPPTPNPQHWKALGWQSLERSAQRRRPGAMRLDSPALPGESGKEGLAPGGSHFGEQFWDSVCSLCSSPKPARPFPFREDRGTWGGVGP